MPIIQIAMMEGRSVAQKRAMVAAVTQVMVDTLGANPKAVRIIINELVPEHFAVGGITAGEQPLASRADRMAPAEASS